jgi:hypothetical protein
VVSRGTLRLGRVIHDISAITLYIMACRQSRSI